MGISTWKKKDRKCCREIFLPFEGSTNDDKWMPFHFLMQLYGIITVKMKSTSLTSLFFHLSNHISHWILYSQSTPESFLTHAHAGVCAHTSGAGIETSPCQLSRLTAHGSCPNPLIASQARGRKSDKGRLWRWHNKTMNKVAVKWAECVRSEEKSYQSPDNI